MWAEEGQRGPQVLAWLTFFYHGGDVSVGLQMRQNFGWPLFPHVEHYFFRINSQTAAK